MPENPTPSTPSAQSVQMIYFNGFTIGMGGADFSVRLKIDNVDQLELKASYTVIKTLAEKLNLTVKKFESITNHNLMTVEEVVENLKKQQEAEKTK